MKSVRMHQRKFSIQPLTQAADKFARHLRRIVTRLQEPDHLRFFAVVKMFCVGRHNSNDLRVRCPNDYVLSDHVHIFDQHRIEQSLRIE